MVLADNLDVKSEDNAVPKKRKKIRVKVKDGKVENGILKQDDQVRRQGVNGTCGNSGVDGASDRNCCSENCEEKNIAESSISQTKTKERHKKEMSLQEMYDGQNISDDDDDDSDWDPVENPGSDWEPVERHVEVTRWFCTNCTMVNFDDMVHCDICGEHKESGILKHGFLASPLLPDGYSTDFEMEIKETHRVDLSQNPAPVTAVGFDERMLLHDEVEMKSHPHPERPDRIRAIAASLATAGLFPGRCFPITAREITREELQLVHSLEHVEDVDLTSRIFASYFTPDTYANEHSACAARLAAGLCADLASAIVSGRVKNGFALVRPPGHHAGVRQAMGFCLHNNAAVAALAAQAAGAKKVLIVDWDVHHGNGTQEIFEQNKSVLYISLHRHEGGKFYPGTGAAHEIREKIAAKMLFRKISFGQADQSQTKLLDSAVACQYIIFQKLQQHQTHHPVVSEVGTMGAEGYCVNVPWSRKGVGDNDYVFAFQQVVLPIASEFAPDLTIISAGFDAARGDPLGCCDVTPTGYAKMTEMLNDVSGGKLLVILEGGYNLRSISSSATAVIKVLLGESPDCELENTLPSKSGLETVLDVLGIQMSYWPNLGSVLAELQSQLGKYALRNKRRKIMKQRRGRILVPLWWRCGRKSTLYRFLTAGLHVKRRRNA